MSYSQKTCFDAKDIEEGNHFHLIYAVIWDYVAKYGMKLIYLAYLI